MDQQPVQPQQQTTPPVAPAPQATPPSGGKSRVMTIVIAVVASVVVVFILIIGLIYFLGKSSDSTSGSSSSTETVKKEAKLGSTIDLGNIEVSVGDIEKKAELDQYQQAPDGKEYVLTHIKVSNRSKSDLSVSSGFELRTKENKVVICTTPYGDGYEKFDDQIAPKGETEGDLYCEISKDDDVKSINFKTYGTDTDYKTYEAVFTN